MSYNALPIKGAFFRPPAKLVLDSLPVGAPLFLCAEPDNQYDPNAVAVWVLSEKIPASAHAKLEADLPRFGFDLDTFLSQEQWHLGYIAKEFAKLLKESGTINNEIAIEGELSLNGNNPYFRFSEAVL